MEPPHHGLRTGVEVDYNVVDSYWIPARVEDTRSTATEEVVCVRFTIGAVDVLHVLDLRVRAHRGRLAPLGTQFWQPTLGNPKHPKLFPILHKQCMNTFRAACSMIHLAAGMKSCPLVNRQPVDYLRRQNASGALGPSQQWQRCEVVTEHVGLKASGYCRDGISFGGSQKVALKIVSSGSKVLGVTYAIAEEHINDDPYTTLPISSRTKPEVRLGNALGKEHVLCGTELLAAGGTFGKWVPSSIEIEPVKETDMDPNLLFLSRRARSCFASCVETTARYNLGGREALIDFDLLDILPPRLRNKHRAGKRADEVMAEALAGFHAACADLSASPHTKVGYQVHTSATTGSTVRMPQLWFLGRVKFETLPAGGTVPFVYWFEPTIETTETGSVLRQLLMRTPVSSVRSFAPAGTYTLPFVRSMQLDTRRIGGCWASSSVASADPYLLRVAVHRRPKEADVSAEKPKDIMTVAKGTSTFRSAPARSATPRKTFDLNDYFRHTHDGVMSNMRLHSGSVTSGAGASTMLSQMEKERSVLDAFGVLGGLDDESDKGATAVDTAESIPHQRWRFCVARAGHYCSLADASPKTAPRRGSVFFRSAESSAKTTSAVGAAAKSALHGLTADSSALPPHAADRVRRRTMVSDFFSR